MSSESDALRDALEATDPTDEQRHLIDQYEIDEAALRESERVAIAESERVAGEAAEAVRLAAVAAQREKDAEEEAEREEDEEAEADALQAAQAAAEAGLAQAAAEEDAEWLVQEAAKRAAEDVAEADARLAQVEDDADREAEGEEETNWEAEAEAEVEEEAPQAWPTDRAGQEAQVAAWMAGPGTPEEQEQTRHYMDLLNSLDPRSVADAGWKLDEERTQSRIREHDRLMARAAEKTAAQDAADLAAANQEIDERRAADAERLGVDWSPDATGKKFDKQFVALSDARFDEAAANLDAKRAQERTIQRLAGQHEVEFPDEPEPEPDQAQRASRTADAAQRVATGNPEGRARVQHEAEIEAAAVARATAAGMTWNVMPANAKESAEQRIELDRREKLLGIAPPEQEQERDTGIER